MSFITIQALTIKLNLIETEIIPIGKFKNQNVKLLDEIAEIVPDEIATINKIRRGSWCLIIELKGQGMHF